MSTNTISDVTAVDIIHWLNEHLADYANEVLELRRENAELKRRIERYRVILRDDRRRAA